MGHLATALAGIIWMASNKILFEFIKKTFLLFKNFLYEMFLFLFSKKKISDAPENIYMLFGLAMSGGIITLRILAPVMFKNTNGAIIGVIFASFMLIAEMNQDTSENVDFKQFGKVHLGSSIFMNFMAFVPGASRLGSVYTCLRMLRLNRKESFAIAVSEGAIGIVIQQIASILLQHKNIFSVFAAIDRNQIAPFVLCGLVYFIMLNIVMSKEKHWFLCIIVACCMYRIYAIPFLG